MDPEALMQRIRLTAIALTLGALLALPTAGEPQHATPVEPGDWPPGCRIPYGYTAACGYYASTAGGECFCRESDNETTLCMKSNAQSGCGIYENENDPCCKASSGF
jgi:hypothetical protein